MLGAARLLRADRGPLCRSPARTGIQVRYVAIVNPRRARFLILVFAAVSAAGCGDLFAGGRSASNLRLAATDVCDGVGYLCEQLLDSASFRVLRWPDTVTELRIEVPAPVTAEGVSAERAERMRDAAVRGIRAWDGMPLRLRVNDPDAADPHITIEWVRTLPGQRVGMARIQWVEFFGRTRFSVPSIQVATHLPWENGRVQTPGEVQVVALHEMGHALGLPHSGNPMDVMYSSNQARPLSIRDRRTARALYGLPNGARILRGEPVSEPRR